MEVFLNPHFPAFKSTVGVLPSPVVWARCNAPPPVHLESSSQGSFGRGPRPLRRTGWARSNPVVGVKPTPFLSLPSPPLAASAPPHTQHHTLYHNATAPRTTWTRAQQHRPWSASATKRPARYLVAAWSSESQRARRGRRRRPRRRLCNRPLRPALRLCARRRSASTTRTRRARTSTT